MSNQITPNPNQLKGEYQLVITNQHGHVQTTPWFDNIILNSGLDAIGVDKQPLYSSRFSVGTGTSVPNINQTQLDAKIASIAGTWLSQVNNGSPSYSTTHTFRAVFDQGAVVGNITEIAINGGPEINEPLFSRALILNNAGVPTSITITSLDQLTVYYRLSVFPYLSDFSGTMEISGTSYQYTGRAGQVSGTMAPAFRLDTTSYGYCGFVYGPNATLGTIDGQPEGGYGSGGAVNFGYPTNQAYVPGSYSSTSSALIGITYESPINVFYIMYGNMSGPRYQIALDTPIPKSNTNELRINVSVSWARKV